MNARFLLRIFKKSLTLSLLFSIVLEASVTMLVAGILAMPHKALAAQVVIESSPNTTASTHTNAGSNLVFTDDQVGYKFYRRSTGQCAYSKTVNGGTSWSAAVNFDTQTDCIALSVWYDKWTPGDSGNYIHLATIDTSLDEIHYNRLDTTNDSLLLSTSISAASGLAGTFAAGTNVVNITKGTDGVIYAVADDSNGTQLRMCSTNCGVSTSWSTPGTAPQGNANSWTILMPLQSGNIMLINRSTANQIRYSNWNGSTWSSFIYITAAAVRNTTYDVGMALTVDVDTNDIYLVYAADNDTFTTADHDIRTAKYSAGSWTNMTDVITNDPTRGILNVAIARDQNNGNIYVGYTARSTIGTASTGNVYWVRSTDGMSSWGAENGPMDTTNSDMYGIDMNLSSYERIYVTWYDVTDTDIIGDTIADIGPQVQLSSRGSQLTSTRHGISDLYIGGSFVLNSLSSHDLTNVSLTEVGTIQAQDDINNVKIFYEFDTSAPYDCASESYNGSESQFGSTVTGGFSGADGVANFTSSPINFTNTSTMCLYVVLDVGSSASDGSTIEVVVNNPETDIVISGSDEAYPATTIALPGTTTVVDPSLTQFGYHWRNDNGSETTATSATGGTANTALTALQIGAGRRLRIGVANQGSTTTLPTTYRLEYAEAAPTCADASAWNVVNDSGAAWLMRDSANITDGANTTNIAVGSGGVTDLGGTSFVSTNGGLRDISNTSGTVDLNTNQFIELEYSIVATSTATEGTTYCFRVTKDTGEPLSVYGFYPAATISADVAVTSAGSQITTAQVLSTNVYAGGVFAITENSSSRNVTSITVSEAGTVSGDSGLSNLKLFYEFDTSAPYNCVSESYSGTESQYGLTSVGGFSDINESAVFVDTVGITTTSAMCVYVVYDVTGSARSGEEIQIEITSASSDVVVDGGASVGPSGAVRINATTTIEGPNLTQSHYHWRNDNGSETTATSATGGSEDVALEDFSQSTPIRLRLGVTNTGLTGSVPTRFKLEYAPKITTCDAASVWTDIDSALDGWDMFDSSFLTNGANTTNIAVGSGGVSNGTGGFIASNGGIRDTESITGTTTIPVNDYFDLEFSITSTEYTSYDTSYCFRVSSDGTAFDTYTNYAEIKTAPKRDFKIQRGSVQVSGTSATLVAGTDYTAPASSSLAFVRITNSHDTGAGNTNATAGQNADDVTAYISNPGNLLTNFTISRPPAATSNTRVDWEIIEFIGSLGTDNEIKVRSVGTASYTSTGLTVSGSAVSGVVDDSKVVVFVTGAANRNTSRNYYASQVTSEWDSLTDTPVFTRAANGGSIVDISYAVVEFTGLNWNVERVEHSYTAAGTIETENITAVNSLAKTFLYTQKRTGATTNVLHYGHEVWLSSIGAVSFQLEAGASVAIEQTSVVWVIENIQNGLGAMDVQRSNGLTTGGTRPLSLSINIPTPIDATNNTSISANTRAAGANTTYPRPLAAFTITSTSTYQIWRSNTGSALTYRVEIIEWPVADLSIRQNYYRFYVDNNELTPTDPWPNGFADLGENTSITVSDEPLGPSDRVRLRMSIITANANMPAGLTNFKLQYGLRATTCSAVTPDNWHDVGAALDSAVWRGFNATGTADGTVLSSNPPTGGDLLISVSNIAGVLVHDNPSDPNPYPVDAGDNIEYDWYIEHNGALPQSTYCFRAVRSDGTPLDAYNNYPQIRTAGFTPVTKNWRWYSDTNNEVPTTPLANENIAPIDVANTDTLTLRVSVGERRTVLGENIKFKLQFADDITFSNPVDVVASSTCGDHSLWCYENGPVPDNQTITTTTLSDADSCVGSIGAGCGTHNSSGVAATGHYHEPAATAEYSFTIKQVAARVNAVYYFRLYDVTNDAPVSADFGENLPSLVTEGPLLSFSLAGIPSGTLTAGVITDVSTTPNGIGFGALSLNTDLVAAHRVTVVTNATEGYQLFKFARNQLHTSNGSMIPSITASNAIPSSWSTACSASSTGCFGYHATDPTLKDGSTRFAPTDSYAGLETTPVEVMYSSIPTSDTHDIVYRIRVNELQPAGNYEAEIVYLAVPSY